MTKQTVRIWIEDEGSEENGKNVSVWGYNDSELEHEVEKLAEDNWADADYPEEIIVNTRQPGAAVVKFRVTVERTVAFCAERIEEENEDE